MIGKIVVFLFDAIRVKIDKMAEKKLIDSEYEWIVRACTNGFNVYLTMMHFIFYDNTLSLQPENSGKRNAVVKINL